MFGEKTEKEWENYSHDLFTKMKGKTLLLDEKQVDPKSKSDIIKNNFPFKVKIVSTKEMEDAILKSDPNVLVAVKGSNSKMYQAFNISFCDDFSSLTLNVNNKFLVTNEGLQEFVKADGLPKHILLIPGKEYHEKK